ncbi:MAG TPA: thermonuclease family protein [Micropepsaceae bacterium]|nr:thermonuclease family protein [Micropepsaceae bacterium]
MNRIGRFVARLCTAAGLFLLASTIAVASAAELTGRVVAVADGDTFTLLTDTKEQIRVRLTEIDAPESDQPWGQRAKQALSSLVSSEAVRVVTAGRDQYGRTLGRVYVAGKDVNAEMLRTGSAWAYGQYLTDRSLLGIQEQAQIAHRGLWSLSMQNRVPPWNWRHDGPRKGVTYTVELPQAARPLRRDRADYSIASSQVAAQQCNGKRFCRQMTSCAEARFYFKVCQVHSLDGDNDGIPCEIMCR